jgi:hypothetical protein
MKQKKTKITKPCEKQEMGKLLLKNEEISRGMAHTKTRKNLIEIF